VSRPFAQVDVFSETPYVGNPVAVVFDAEGLAAEHMQQFARWTNLSETAFVMQATDPGADYRVRIFTKSAELPFAGHPTLGTCHAWIAHADRGDTAEVIVQQCAAGLVPIRRTSFGLAFAAPPLIRRGPVDEDTVRRASSMLNLDRDAISDAQWVDNGPGWVGLLLADADAVLALRPGIVELPLGVVGPYPAGSVCAFEVRAFLPSNGGTVEDPVTGSLNASLAEWLSATDRAHPPYVASQGCMVGAAGRVHVEMDAGGAIWVGGGTLTAIVGRVAL
jgi:PhzF family phenazine biosynthesis protein